MLGLYKRMLRLQGQAAPLDARLSLVPEAMKVGLRSEMGLALAMLPPTACGDGGT